MKVNEIQIVVGFELTPSIALITGSELEKLRKKLSGEIKTFPVPDQAPPSLPRLVLRTSDTAFNIAPERYQFSISPPSHISNNVEECVEFSRSKFNTIFSALEELTPAYEWSGIIIMYNIPDAEGESKNVHDAATPLFDRLIHIDRKDRPLCNFDLKIGFTEGDVNVLYELTGYEVRESMVQMPQSMPIVMKQEDMALVETGKEIKVDVNTKPSGRIEKTAREDVHNLLDQHINQFNSLETNLNLKGIM